MGRILAIDYGLKRCGIAVSDPQQMIATPLDWVPTKDLLMFILDYCTQNEVETIVLGYPLGLNGEPTHATKGVEGFAKVLKHRLPRIPLVFNDEQFSSKRAVEEMVKSGMKKKQRSEKGNVDAMSAALILKDFIESRTS